MATQAKCTKFIHIIIGITVFSLRAPTQPVKPMTKVMAPAQMKMKAGSSAMLVSLLRLLKVSFSDQAQIPIASTPSPSS